MQPLGERGCPAKGRCWACVGVVLIGRFDKNRGMKATHSTSEMSQIQTVLATANLMAMIWLLLRYMTPFGWVFSIETFGGARAEFLSTALPCTFCGFSILELPRDHPTDGTPKSWIKENCTLLAPGGKWYIIATILSIAMKLTIFST